MKKLYKDFRTNLMYWRFRHITRNRLRLRSWWVRRRSGSRPSIPPGYAPLRPRGGASRVYRGSSQRSWIALGVMVGLLTALKVGVEQTYVNAGLVYLVGSLIVVGCVYWALRGV